MNDDDRILTPAEAWPHVPPLVAARFASKVLIGTRDECWIWTGRDAARTGDRRAVRELLERPSIQYALF